jgi:transcriptional regulator with XRE-family HTH domain
MKSPLGGPDPVDVHIGQQLRTLRRSRGFTQQALAGRVGVTYQQIQKYENGRNRISASMLYAFALVLAVPFGSFIDGLPPPAEDAEGG